MTTLENTSNREFSAASVVSKYGQQTALFLELGQKLGAFVTEEDQQEKFYTQLRSIQAVAFLIEQTLKKYPDRARVYIDTLCQEVSAGKDVYGLFLDAYLAELQDPIHLQGSAFEAQITQSELIRVRREKMSPADRKRGPHFLFWPQWYREITEHVGVPSQPLSPFDSTLAHALSQNTHQQETKNALLDNFTATDEEQK